MCTLSRFSHVQLFSNPMDCSLPGSSTHGILQVRILEWVALLQGIFQMQGSNPCLSHLLHWQVDSLPLVPPVAGVYFLATPLLPLKEKILSTEKKGVQQGRQSLYIKRVPWTERMSNQSILKEINPEYSLEGLMLKLKLQYFGHLM